MFSFSLREYYLFYGGTIGAGVEEEIRPGLLLVNSWKVVILLIPAEAHRLQH